LFLIFSGTNTLRLRDGTKYYYFYYGHRRLL